MEEEIESKSNVGEALMNSSDRVEATIETEDHDLFDDVFGEDDEEKEAKKRMAEKANILKQKRNSKEARELKAKKSEEENTDTEEEKEAKADKAEDDEEDNSEDDEGEEDSDDDAEIKGNKTVINDKKSDKKSDDSEDDDEDEVLEEDEEDSAEPVIFGEVKDAKEEEEFETKDDAFDAVDAGGKKKKNSNNNFDDIINEKLNNSLNKSNSGANGKENIAENGKKKSNGYGGKLDLKVTHEEDEEEEVTKAHPVERAIIKSVIRNKAMMAAQGEVKINKGVKINDDSITSRKQDEDHDEMADDLMREDGIKEEGIEDEVDSEEDADENAPKSKMPKANLVEEDETEDGKDGVIKPELEFLMSEKGHAYIGRKKSVLNKYGEEAGLFVGRVNEKDKEGTDVYLDGLNPHVVFVCGARGSGKSYVLGVVAEELALKNKNVGIVVVDPIGVFWSMKHPNKEEKELEALAKWGIMPKGLNNIKVFIPVGMKDSVPKSTYDAVFSIQPSLLTAEDWCLTFGIDRFSPTGLLMEKGIAKVKSGYSTEEGKEVRGKQNTFSLDDLAKCFEFDAELNDREKGYKADSIRALVSRFDAAKHWGIFDEKGTSLGLLSRAGQMTILDTSFLEDNVSALVVGIIARRLLSARKLGTRREAAGKFDDNTAMEDIVELNIPPTWLFIDEAHTLIPGGNQKTPASSALVEYVKQGRRPGCSLVFATQQPSAIDSKVLSQLDIIMAHKLVFDDDIKSIYKRTPTIVPFAYKKSNFIKTMPVGIALTGDRSETTSRAFVMSIRPRMSQHEGRDAETTDEKQELETEQVEVLAVNIALNQLKKDPSIRIDSIKETLDTLNNTYKKNVSIDKILKELEKKGLNVKDDSVYAKGVLEEMEAEKEEEEALKAEEEEALENENTEEGYGAQMLKPKKLPKDVEKFGEQLHEFDEKVELTALRPVIDEQRARKSLAGFAAKKFLFPDEILDRVVLKHAQLYKVKYKYFNHKDAFQVGEAYINSLTGEFIHDDRGALVESKGLPIFMDLNESESTMFKLVAEKKRTPKDAAVLMKMEEGNAKRVLDSLTKKGLLQIQADSKGNPVYAPGRIEIELPPTPLHEMLSSIGKKAITEIESAAVIAPALNERDLPALLNKLWGNVSVKEVTHLFLPVWEGVLKKRTGEERVVMIDAINGKQINLD